jgi:hypothetical protein
MYFTLESSDITESLSGTDGTDSVSVSVEGFGPDVAIGSGDTTNPFGYTSGSACISSVECSDYFSFIVGGGNGYLNLYDSTDDLVAQATLVGWLTVTYGGAIPGDASPYDYQKTFVVSPTPEPGTAWLLLGAGVAICGTRIRISGRAARGRSK